MRAQALRSGFAPVVALSATLVAGCTRAVESHGDGSADVVDAQRLCDPGAAVACACFDGRAGTQRCSESGREYGSCECSPGDAGPSTDTSVPDVASIDVTTTDARDAAIGEDAHDDAAVDASSDGEASDAGAIDAPDDSPADAGPGREACAPRSCDLIGATCGHYADGCLGVVDCGPCHAPTVQSVALDANSIVADRSRDVVYASVPSRVATYGDTVAIIDAASAAITGSISVGSEPWPMAMSDDSRELYVSLYGTHAIRHVDLTTRTPVGQFTFPPAPHPSYVLDAMGLVVMAGQPHRVVAALAMRGVSPGFVGDAVFDDGVIAPFDPLASEGARAIVEGDADTIYGFDDETSGEGFFEIAIDGTGAHTRRAIGGLLIGADIRLASDREYVYSNHGDVIEGAAVARRGHCPTTGLPVPDRARGRVYFVRSPLGGGATTLDVCDLATFTLLDSATIPGLTGVALQAVRFASDGIAVRLSSTGSYGAAPVFLVRSALIAADAP